MFKKKPLDLKSIKEKNLKRSKRRYAFVFGFISIIIISFIGIFAFASLSNINVDSLFSSKINLKENDKKISEKKSREKVNILLLGKGGIGHDAPDLTDTIILTSINTKYKTISMLSIPRDLYVVYEGKSTGKLNGIYAREMSLNDRDNKKSISVLADKVTEITGEDIDYYMTIDFKGFEAFIDTIGGIKLTVDKKIVDTSYPDYKGGYQTFTIKEGTWKFDGETALKYARSRHSTSDFDRALRQQKIISAIKDKLGESGFFSKISKIKDFYNIFTKYIKTDISIMSAVSLYSEVGDYSKYKILSFNLNDSCYYGDFACKTGGFLYIPDRNTFGGASVLLIEGSTASKLSNYKSIIPFMNLIFDYPIIYKENKQINIFNTTKTSGIANSFAMGLKKNGFNIPDKKYAGSIKDSSFSGSFISYEKGREKTATLKILEDLFDLKSKQNFSGSTIEILDENTEIEVILGDDYKKVMENLSNNL